MISLGLDPSLTGFGWLVINPTVLGPERVIDSGVVNTESKQIFVSRYLDLKAVVVYLLDKYPEITSVGVESPPFGEQFSEGLYALFVSINEACYLSRKDVVHFDPTTVKMLVRMDPSVRRGTIDKSDVIEAVKAETGIKKWNHNAADAYIIARSAAHFYHLLLGLSTPEELTPAEYRAYCRVHTFAKGVNAGKTVKQGILFKENSRFYRFSQIPQTSEDEELRQWLRQKGSLKLNRQK